MVDFVDVSLVFLIVVLLAYAVYAVRAVLVEQEVQEQLFIETPNMHFIPFSLRQLQSALLGVNNSGKSGIPAAAWKELLLKVELLYGARYHLLKGALLDDFEPFDPNLDVPNELPESKLMMLEDRFLSNFRHMMSKGNYAMLSQKECDLAQASNFLNTVPIVPEWLKMDPLFQRYMDAHPDWAAACFEKSRRIWIFHRGVGVATFTGTLFLQKLDALLFRMFGRCCGKKAPKSEVAEPAVGVEGKRPPGVERVSIRSIAAKHGWGSLLKSQTIQEPTFKEVVLAYRINQQRDPLFGSGNPHGIHIKVFRDIPHADLEARSPSFSVFVSDLFLLQVCYPCKTTTLRPLDVVKFAGAGIFGLISILMQRKAGELVGYSALTGFVTLAVSVLFDYQYHQTVYEQTTLRDLYSKSKDSDQGALTYLMEQVGIQEVKVRPNTSSLLGLLIFLLQEVFLGYFFLLSASKPLSLGELDAKVEAFLAELQVVLGHRECKIDFEADDALEKLVSMHLVTEADGKYTAVPLQDGIEELTAQWAAMLQATQDAK